MAPAYAIATLWGLWLLSWLIAAGWSSQAVRRRADGAEALARILSILGFALMLGSGWRYPAILSTLGTGQPVLDWLLVAATAGAFAFCWWARLHLGSLWSVATTAKSDHRIVDTGPYGVVRHPIYTGLIAAAAAYAVFKHSPGAISGAFVLALAFWLKARVEERFLAQELGAEAYGAYARRVPMLIPFARLG